MSDKKTTERKAERKTEKKTSTLADQKDTTYPSFPNPTPGGYPSLSDLEKFLLYLAQNAHPKRFLPFPDEYRKAPPVYQTDEKSNAKTPPPNGKILSSSTLGASFAPYTEEEYAAVKRDLDYLESNPGNYPRLRKYLNTLELGMVQHMTSSLHPTIKEFEFKYSDREEFIRNIHYPKRWYLFHGSPLENWHSILRNGLRNMSNTTYMTDGATEGVGVYLADDIRTSYRYGSQGGYYGNQRGLHCISVVEVLEDPAPYKVPVGWYVIPNDKILVVRYLLQISVSPAFDGKEILSYYSRMREGLVKNKALPSRLNSEEKSLATHGVTIVERISPYIWIVLFDNVLVKMYLQSFPFSPPILQLVYKVEGSDENPKYDDLYIPNDWSPAVLLISVLMSFRDDIFGKNMPSMTETLVDVQITGPKNQTPRIEGIDKKT